MTWEERAEMANRKGWELLYAAKQCFELAEAAKANAKRKAPEQGGEEKR